MKRIFSHTWKVLTTKERKHFRWLITGDIIISILDIIFLAMLLWIVRFYIQPGEKTMPLLPAWLSNKNSISLIALFLLLFAIKNITAYFVAKAHYQFNNRVALRITQKNLDHYQYAEFEEFVNVDSSTHFRKINLQPFEFCQYILSGIQQISTQIFLITLSIIAILLYNAKLFVLLLLVLVPPVIVIFYLIKRRLGKAKGHIRSGNESSYRYLLDAIKGYIESNVYDRHDFFTNRYMHERKRFGKYLFESISLQNMPPRIIEIFAVLGLFLLIAIAKWSGNTDSSYLVTIGAFIAAAYKIIPGVAKIINISGQMKAYEFSLDDLMNTEKKDIKKETPIKKEIYSLRLKNISFSYKNRQILTGFSLCIQPGDFIGISGQSGIGKTTILNLLLGFIDPAEGEILLNNTKVGSAGIKKLWPSVAYVRQQTFLIHDTIVKNITLQEQSYDKERLQCSLEASGLNELIRHCPEGLNKMIAENGKNISGGQQQRIAIARALYKDADLVLLDEPFNELDEISVNKLMAHFSGLASKGKIIVLVTHDQKTLRYCNKLISLNE